MIWAGKASLDADLAPIFERLRLDRHALESTMAKLFQPSERGPNQLSRMPGQSVAHGVRGRLLDSFVVQSKFARQRDPRMIVEANGAQLSRAPIFCVMWSAPYGTTT
jgi:hypothetical protein